MLTKARFWSLLTWMVAFVPKNGLRILLYRTIFRYDISPMARIGFGTRILVEEVHIGSADIGEFNVFTGPMKLFISDGAKIWGNNKFVVGSWSTEAQYRNAPYLRTCTIRESTVITDGHFIDVTGGFELGAGAWIAGFGSQFWTHGAGVVDRSVTIGDNCYLGSAVRFAPGASVGNGCLVGLGSVVTRKFSCQNALIAGVPAAIIKENNNWKTRDHANG